MSVKPVVWIAAGLSIVGAAGAYFAVQPRGLFDPEVRIQSENYVEARRHFRTKLLRKGGSPQRDVLSLTPPPYVEAVEYPSGGLRLNAWLAGHQEPGPPRAAVLFLHGGFEFGAADWDMAVPYWEAGFVVMAPMLRGENGQPGMFSFLYDEVDDVIAAADFLARHPAVDSTQVYLAGHSAGGTLVQLATLASRRFRAAASFDGSPDQQLLYNGSAKKPGNHREVVFDATSVRELEVRSPLAYVLSLTSPIRLYYSYEASPLAQRPSRRFAEHARRRGVDARAVRVWGSHMSHVARAMPNSIDFFKQRLGPEAVRLLRPRIRPPLEPSLTGNTTFTLRGHDSARVVMLAGSFNGWDSQHVLCGKDGAGWLCRIDLPAGKYLYQFVVDDDWINDPDNPRLEDSGNGGVASVIIKR
jgi:Glycogen recognition site of AMP-activated protein kinase/Prolyl oligopeptidase family